MYKRCVFRIGVLALIATLLLLSACKNKTKDSGDSVVVNFFNESSFRVAIYMNVNPSNMDSSTKPLLEIGAGDTQTVNLPPRSNQNIGDVFYVHYYVQLADSFESGVDKAIYVKAKRDMSNIAFVLKDGESYTKTVVQPSAGQLKFMSGYIKVKNTGNYSLQALRGSTYLKRMGDGDLNLKDNAFGFYELDIPNLEDSFNETQLKIFVPSTGKTLSVPSFLFERGKVYSFSCNGLEVKSLGAKDITY